MKKQSIKSTNYLVIILLSLASFCVYSDESPDGKEYLVQFKSGQVNNDLLQSLEVMWSRGEVTFAKGTLTQAQLNVLKITSDVIIEENHNLSLNGGSLKYVSINSENAEALQYSELEPYWLRATAIDKLPHVAHSIPICIIDSGLDASHPDLPKSITGYHSNYAGFWDQDAFSHGTHITGIIAAQENGIGIKGALSDAIPSLHISKLIKTANGANSTIWGSSLIEAIEVCASIGAKVINMSLSGEHYSRVMMEVIDRLSYDKGIIFVGAAGNHGSVSGKLNPSHQDALHYPASYHNVLSVGALNDGGSVAGFSPINNKIDFVTPGTQIVSTANRYHFAIQSVEMETQQGYASIPYTQIDTGTSKPPEQLVMNGSCKYTLTDKDLSDMLAVGELSDMTSLALKSVERGCKESGGELVIIDYPNPESFRLYGLPLHTEFPTILMHANSELLTTNTKMKLVSFNDSYVIGAGTSQATAIMTGGIAKLWSQNQQWTRDEIINALKQTSLDLGTAGKDSQYGYGLPDFTKAYHYLLSGQAPPCPQNWYSNKAYVKGDTVVYNGKVFVSGYWSKGEVPTLNSTKWVNDGYCDSSTSSPQEMNGDAFHLMNLTGLETDDSEYSCKGLTLGCGA
ncbi:S8 family peptidase [Pseudoalteromonas citrea]|nr:S8 family serine peptidase [Pseudoalteromonas citrea]